MGRLWRRFGMIGILALSVSFALPAASAASDTDGAGALPVDLMLVVDNSGSMRGIDAGGMARRMVVDIVDRLPASAQAGLVIFDASVRLAVPLTPVSERQAHRVIFRAMAAVDYSGQFSLSPAAIERAIYELKVNGSADSRKAIVFVSDGVVDTGETRRNGETAGWLLRELTAESRRAGIRIYSLAFSDAADFSVLHLMAKRTQGGYFRVFTQANADRTVAALIKDMTTAAPPSGSPPAPSRPPAATAPPPAASSQGPPPTAPPSTAAPPPPLPAASPEAAAVPTPSPAGRAAAHQRQMVEWVLLALVVLMVLVLAALIVLIWRVRFANRAAYPAAQEPPPPEEEPVPEALLIDLKNVSLRKTTMIRKAVINIGRGANNDVRIPKDTVSGFHATIEYRDGFFFLEDQRSRNATYLNGRRLTPYEPARLKSGDEVVITVFKFIFMLSEQLPSGDTQIVADDEPEKEPQLTYGPTDTRPL
jgi:hypothetical protein